MPDPFTHFVFVDFENVPDFDLDLIAGHPIRVTVLVGKNQTKHMAKLKERLRKLKLKGAVIEVGAAGRNALDIALAYYLGQAVLHNPSARFCIVAKDRGYESLIQHLHGKKVKIARYGETHLLPFLAPAKKSSTKPLFAAPPAVSPKAPKLPAPPKPKVAVDKLPKFIAHLRNSPPSNRTKLEHMIAAYFKPSLPVGGKKGVIAELVKRKIIEIDPAGKVKVHKH